jgi:hypothetical protein
LRDRKAAGNLKRKSWHRENQRKSKTQILPKPEQLNSKDMKGSLGVQQVSMQGEIYFQKTKSHETRSMSWPLFFFFKLVHFSTMQQLGQQNGESL